MLDMNYFKTVQNSQDIHSEPNTNIQEAQLRLRRELKTSINFKENAFRNDEHQEILLVPHTQSEYKCKIIALPNDELYVGDIITVDDLHWIIVETNTTNPVQTSGVAWLCNHLFRFQNHSAEILEYWGVVDDGSYSLPLAGNAQIMFTNNRVDFYLPYNDDTKYLYIDKRIATGTMYDQFRNNILEVYKIEGKKQKLNTYGKGGHLLVLEAVSSQYSFERDNIEECICDYITPIIEELPHESKLNCEIQGRKTLRTGSTNTYSISFATNGVAVWELQPPIDGITITTNESNAYISAEDAENLAGETFKLSCVDADGKYNVAIIEIEVV